MNFIHQPTKTLGILCPIDFHRIEVFPEEINIQVTATDYCELDAGDSLYGNIPLTSDNLDALINNLLKIRNERIIKGKYLEK